MKKYKQISYEERVTIKICLWKKMSIRSIAALLGRSPSSVSREIKRGITLNGTYFAESTERLVRQRKLNDKRKRKMNNLEIIIDNLVDKELLPKVEKIVNTITKNFEEIKNHVQNNEIKYLDNIVYSILQDV